MMVLGRNGKLQVLKKVFMYYRFPWVHQFVNANVNLFDSSFIWILD